MAMMSPGAFLSLRRLPCSAFSKPKIIDLFVIFLLIFCDTTAYSQKVNEDYNEQDWLMCGDPYKCTDQAIQENRTLVKLGYLTAATKLKGRQGLAISGALSYAVKQINKCSCLLPSVELDFVYKDTEGNEQISTESVVDLICNDTAAFIGPEGPNCRFEAMVAGSKNKAMISYRCSDPEVSNKRKYPTFTRMEPPDTQVTSSVLALLAYYKWFKFTIVYQDDGRWDTIAEHLITQAENRNFTINNSTSFKDSTACCVANPPLPCCNEQGSSHSIFSSLRNTKKGTRIYVFMGDREQLLIFMKQMRVEQLFEEGKYMVIYVNPETSTYDELGFNLWRKQDLTMRLFSTCEEMGTSFIKQWRSLIIVTGSPYRIDSEKIKTFDNKVRKYNAEKPFNFPMPFIAFKKSIPIYAAHLYDSVLLYAKALDKMIREKLSNDEIVDVAQLARNGSGITETIIKMGRYESISGSFIKIDKNGDSEGNFTAYALKNLKYQYKNGQFTCNRYPVQVGEFRNKIYSLPSQLWKYDENTLSLENGNGAWQHQEIQWVLPNEGETGSMTDKGTSKVLGLFVLDSTIDGTKVLLEVSDKSAEQMWHRSVANSKGYFTLKNPITGKFLTASSPKTTSMTDQQSEIMYEPKVEIDFVQRPRPKDEPRCGYDGKKCPQDQNSLVWSAIVLGVCLVTLLIITLSIYRKWRAEQEIEGLLWRINPEYLEGYHAMQSYPSKQSLASGRSADSCFMNGREDGRYKGARVRIKLIHFGKKIQLARDIMKEMKLMREIRHTNVNNFIGAMVDQDNIKLVTEFCSKGALFDLLNNPDVKLDLMFVASLISDLVNGMHFLHNSTQLGVHGNLRTSNCLVTSRWQLQITDFGLRELRATADEESEGYSFSLHKLLWIAPELLRDETSRGSQKGDVYSFAIVVYEMFRRSETGNPYGELITLDKVIDLVKYPNGTKITRPDMKILSDPNLPVDVPDYVKELIQSCWNECPEKRPDFSQIRTRLKKLNQGRSSNIMDKMIELMEFHTTHLEELVGKRTEQLFEEKQKTEDLLHMMLPPTIAKQLAEGKSIEPESYPLVTIYFSDIVGFTAMCSESKPIEIVEFLHDLYSIFDRAISYYQVYKVETIGDAYMVVSGLPEPNSYHAATICTLALELLKEVKNFKIRHRPNDDLKLRIGIHSGPVVAGVVGSAMPRYCLFGDTVNTSSRMESTGEPLKIHISKECNAELTKLGGFVTESRGLVDMKGKGKQETYWLLGDTEKNEVRRMKMAPDESKLKPFFRGPQNLVNNVGANSQEVSRRRSPRMSMASGAEIRPGLRNATPDSIRHSAFLQQSANRLDNVANNRNGTPNDSRLEKPNSAPVDPLAKFHYRQLHSPRINKKMLCFNKRRNCSSHTLNIPNSPSISRKKHTSSDHQQTDSNSAQNSPVNYRRLNLKTDLKPRPRSLSDDRMNSNEDELCHYAALLPSETNNDRLTHQNDQQDQYNQLEMEERKPFICDSAII